MPARRTRPLRKSYQGSSFTYKSIFHYRDSVVHFSRPYLYIWSTCITNLCWRGCTMVRLFELCIPLVRGTDCYFQNDTMEVLDEKGNVIRTFEDTPPVTDRRCCSSRPSLSGLSIWSQMRLSWLGICLT